MKIMNCLDLLLYFFLVNLDCSLTKVRMNERGRPQYCSKISSTFEATSLLRHWFNSTVGIAAEQKRFKVY